MKRLIIIIVMLLFSFCGCSSRTVSQDNVKEAGSLVKGLLASSQQMDFQVEPSRASWAPEGFTQIRELAFNLIPTIKITGKIDAVDLQRPGMAYFKWSTTTIYIDLKSSYPEKNLYVESSYGIHKAEAGREQVQKIIEFAKKNHLLK